ncbi:unnamed protein product, partial [Prorocentrum cordatum]
MRLAALADTREGEHTPPVDRDAPSPVEEAAACKEFHLTQEAALYCGMGGFYRNSPAGPYARDADDAVARLLDLELAAGDVARLQHNIGIHVTQAVPADDQLHADRHAVDRGITSDESESARRALLGFADMAGDDGLLKTTRLNADDGVGGIVERALIRQLRND